MLKTEAIVFDVVHGSFVDGWGIRTTIFLKGCPLRCKWCCNPESQRMEPQLQVIEEHCTSCGRCLSRCPKQALILEDGMIRVDQDLCDGCGKCIKSCWAGALHIWGQKRSVQDLFEECLRDKAFYEQSGGGVTLSGGEATMQPAFCLELMELCHKEDISVAVDTCGQVVTTEGIEVLRQADLILFDVKGLDPVRHKDHTGVSNDIILQNLEMLEEMEKDVIIRYPVIPNHNEQEAELIAGFLSGLRCVKRVDLIPYHEFGTGKYDQLGRTYPLQEETMSPEAQQALLQCFKDHGLNARLGG